MAMGPSPRHREREAIVALGVNLASNARLSCGQYLDLAKFARDVGSRKVQQEDRVAVDENVRVEESSSGWHYRWSLKAVSWVSPRSVPVSVPVAAHIR